MRAKLWKEYEADRMKKEKELEDELRAMERALEESRLKGSTQATRYQEPSTDSPAQARSRQSSTPSSPGPTLDTFSKSRPRSSNARSRTGTTTSETTPSAARPAREHPSETGAARQR